MKKIAFKLLLYDFIDTERDICIHIDGSLRQISELFDSVNFHLRDFSIKVSLIYLSGEFEI